MAQPAFYRYSHYQPVGLLDSGVGGLSVLKEVKHLLPGERTLYVADSGAAPYGGWSEQRIAKRVHKLADYMVNKDIKALVVACNTATAAAIETLREAYDIPIIGMEPAIKPAAAITRSGVIGVMATERTLTSERYRRLVESYAGDMRVIDQACNALVRQVEKAPFSEDTLYMVTTIVEPMLAAGMDTLVLGCTHFPIVRSAIQSVAGSRVRIVDSGGSVARQLRARLREAELLSDADAPAGKDRLLTTGRPEALAGFIPYTGLRHFQIDELEGL